VKPPRNFPADWSPVPVLNLLVAFPYVTPAILATVARLGERVRFVIDSGAFTVKNAGKVITLDQYCAFIDTLPIKPWGYFALDVIGDQDASRANYYAMRERGYHPIPIVTRDGPRAFALADEYWTTSAIVGFGGLAGGVATGKMNRRPYVKAILEHAQGRDVHLLGFSSIDFIGRYRPFMCDSASWTAADRFAWLHTYLGYGRWDRHRKFDFMAGFPDHLTARIRNLGFDAHVLQRDAAWRGEYGANRMITAAGWCRFSAEIEQRFGTKLFLALAADSSEVIETAFLAQAGEIDGAATRLALIEAQPITQRRRAAQAAAA
jgi:hypothetical protein